MVREEGKKLTTYFWKVSEDGHFLAQPAKIRVMRAPNSSDSIFLL